MKISIITASYNSEETIRTTIESVLHQDFPEIEYIVIDGASSDGTINIVNEYKEKIAKIVSENDDGIYDALNKGLSIATGEFVGFLHADDQFDNKHVISRIASEIESENADFIYGDIKYIGKKNSKTVRYWKSRTFSSSLLGIGWMPPHPSVYIRRSKYAKYGVFDSSLRISGDYDMMLRFLSKADIKTAYIPEVFVRMRLGGVSNRSLRNIIQKTREDYYIIKKNGFRPLPVLIMKNIIKIKQFFI